MRPVNETKIVGSQMTINIILVSVQLSRVVSSVVVVCFGMHPTKQACLIECVPLSDLVVQSTGLDPRGLDQRGWARNSEIQFRWDFLAIFEF